MCYNFLLLYFYNISIGIYVTCNGTVTQENIWKRKYFWYSFDRLWNSSSQDWHSWLIDLNRETTEESNNLRTVSVYWYIFLDGPLADNKRELGVQWHTCCCGYTQILVWGEYGNIKHLYWQQICVRNQLFYV